MTIEELYLWAKKNGREDHEILLSEPENDACVLAEEHIKAIGDCEGLVEFEGVDDLSKKAIVLDCWKY
jgi:hypothetical protein